MSEAAAIPRWLWAPANVLEKPLSVPVSILIVLPQFFDNVHTMSA